MLRKGYPAWGAAPLIDPKSSERMSMNGSFAGIAWFIGWLFTLGFLKLLFWPGVLALFIWPYYLGRHFSG